MFNISLSMSSPRSIYVVSMKSIFIAINHITSLKQTQLIFVHFLENLSLFLGDKADEESE